MWLQSQQSASRPLKAQSNCSGERNGAVPIVWHLAGTSYTSIFKQVSSMKFGALAKTVLRSPMFLLQCAKSRQRKSHSFVSSERVLRLGRSSEGTAVRSHLLEKLGPSRSRLEHRVLTRRSLVQVQPSRTQFKISNILRFKTQLKTAVIALLLKFCCN